MQGLVALGATQIVAREMSFFRPFFEFLQSACPHGSDTLLSGLGFVMDGLSYQNGWSTAQTAMESTASGNEVAFHECNLISEA